MDLQSIVPIVLVLASFVCMLLSSKDKKKVQIMCSQVANAMEQLQKVATPTPKKKKQK